MLNIWKIKENLLVSYNQQNKVKGESNGGGANEQRKNKTGGKVKNKEHKAPPNSSFERRYRAVLKKLALNERIYWETEARK